MRDKREEETYIIPPPPPPKPDTTQSTHGATDGRYVQQWGIPNRTEDLLLDDVARGGGRVCRRGGVVVDGEAVAVAEGGESRGEDDVAGQQDPGEEGGVDVVHAGDLVEGEEHFSVRFSMR